MAFFYDVLQSIHAINSSAYAAPVGVLLLMYISWWCWTFVIRPRFHPDDPKLLPYSVPVIGHAIAFFKDTESTCTRGRQYFKNTREPFQMNIAGQRFYVITSPQDAAAVYANKKTLSFDDHIANVFRMAGLSPDGQKKMWEVSTHHPKSLAHMGEESYRKQFLPGEKFDELWPTIFGCMEKHLDPQQTLGNLPRREHIDLFEWSRDTMLESMIDSVFGPILRQIAPDFVEKWNKFEDESWKFFYQLPELFAKDMNRLRRSLVSDFQRYLDLSEQTRAGSCWLVQNLASEMSKAGISTYDIATIYIPVSLTAFSNTNKLLFWVMTYLLFDPALFTQIKAEVDCCEPDTIKGTEAQVEASYPRLIAVYNEALRMSSASASIRTVASVTRVRQYVLQPKSLVLIPMRQLHFNDNAFGSNVQEFDPQRFMQKSLSKDPSFRPFGGGVTYCPGRLLARRQVLAFVILVLQRYDIKVEPGQGFPRIDERKPSLGVLTPVKGDEVHVTLSERRKAKESDE